MTAKTSPRRFEAVSSGPKRRNVVRVPGDHVAQEAAEDARRLARASSPGSVDVDGVVAEVGQGQVLEQHAAVRVRVRAHPPLARGRERARAPAAAGRARRTAPRAGSCAATPRGSARWPAFSRAAPTGTWCERQVPSTWTPSTSRGPVQPFGVRRTIIGQRGRSPSPPLARRLLDRADLVERLVERRGEALVDVGRRLVELAVDDAAAASRSPRRARRARARGCGRARSGSRSCSRSGAGSAGRRRRCAG